MLVSAIANFRAIHDQHRAGLSMMQTSNAMLSGIRQAGMGNTNFEALHQQDVKNSTDMARAQLMYMYASAWKKHAEAKMKQEAKSVNYLA